AKIGVDGVATELRERGVPAASVEALAGDLGDPAGHAQAMRERVAGSELGAAGIAEVDRVRELVGGLPAGEVVADSVLARGLGYYTGPVFEVVHDGLDVTIAAGGRYDGLVGMFQGRAIPATGGSLGLERILLLLEDRERDAAGSAVTGPQVLVTALDEGGA